MCYAASSLSSSGQDVRSSADETLSPVYPVTLSGRAQGFWSCHKYILQFYNQEWHPRNRVLGVVLFTISTGHPFNPHSVISPGVYTRFHSDFTSTLISVTNLLHMFMWDNQYVLPQTFSKRFQDGIALQAGCRLAGESPEQKSIRKDERMRICSIQM